MNAITSQNIESMPLQLLNLKHSIKNSLVRHFKLCTTNCDNFQINSVED